VTFPSSRCFTLPENDAGDEIGVSPSRYLLAIGFVGVLFHFTLEPQYCAGDE